MSRQCISYCYLNWKKGVGGGKGRLGIANGDSNWGEGLGQQSGKRGSGQQEPVSRNTAGGKIAKVGARSG